MKLLNDNLKKYAYFSDGLLNAINETMKENIFYHGDTILKRGSVNHRVYFIISGLIKIVGEFQEKPVIPYILGAENFVIATDSFFRGDPTKFEIIAVEDVVAVSATSEELDEIGKQFNELGPGIFKIHLAYRDQYENRINELNALDPIDRYEWFVKNRRDLLGRLKDEDIWTHLGISSNTYYKAKNRKYKKIRAEKQ